MYIVSVPPGNGDTGEQNAHASSMSSAGALHCYVEGTVANHFDKVVLVYVITIKAVITRQ
jgi:hypothetical protein